MQKNYVSARNTLILLFVMFHVFSIMFWNFYWSYGWDKKEDQTVFNTVKYYVQPTGLWQAWNIFAPPPQVLDYLTITGRDGDFVVEYEPDYQSDPTKLNHELERKWHENAIKGENSELLRAYLMFWCKEFEKEYNKEITSVSVFVSTQRIPGLDSGTPNAKTAKVRRGRVEC